MYVPSHYVSRKYRKLQSCLHWKVFCRALWWSGIILAIWWHLECFCRPFIVNFWRMNWMKSCFVTESSLFCRWNGMFYLLLTVQLWMLVILGRKLVDEKDLASSSWQELRKSYWVTAIHPWDTSSSRSPDCPNSDTAFDCRTGLVLLLQLAWILQAMDGRRDTLPSKTTSEKTIASIGNSRYLDHSYIFHL